MRNDPIYVHLGAFDKAVEGWYNVDITPHQWIARVPFAAQLLRAAGKMSDAAWAAHRNGNFRKLHYVDLTRSLPFSDGSVGAFFSSHVFEHLFGEEVERLVMEIYRCLLPGGICRVAVPDLDEIIALYDSAQPEPFLEQMFEARSRRDITHSHHYGFTGKSISDLFERKGFSKCAVLSFRKGQCPDIDKLDNRPSSLFFEATK